MVVRAVGSVAKLSEMPFGDGLWSEVLTFMGNNSGGHSSSRFDNRCVTDFVSIEKVLGL